MENGLLNPELLQNPNLDVMNFLNEVSLKFPKAIPFSSGRPVEDFFQISHWMTGVERFVALQSVSTSIEEEKVRQSLGQYGRTNGIIHDLVAQMLKKDEDISISPSDVMLTAGCQEAMIIALTGLFDRENDVLLVMDPTYIGITGLATLLGVEMVSVIHDNGILSLESLQKTLSEIRQRGKKPKAFYVIPDFNNPLGNSLSLTMRKELLTLCHDENLLILEDNPYGMFRYEGEKIPTLMALDKQDVVVYLGTFSKTLCPGFRIGYLLGKQKIQHGGKSLSLIEELSKVKSLTTVNTSPLLQALVGAVLLEEGGSLKNYIQPMLDYYKKNRDCMVQALQESFAKTVTLGEKVKWNIPEGGFFLSITLPFSFTPEHLAELAEKHGVLVMPMSFFSIENAYQHQIRLSFSYVTPEQIQTGVGRLVQFLDQVFQQNQEKG